MRRVPAITSLLRLSITCGAGLDRQKSYRPRASDSLIRVRFHALSGLRCDRTKRGTITDSEVTPSTVSPKHQVIPNFIRICCSSHKNSEFMNYLSFIYVSRTPQESYLESCEHSYLL